MSTNHSVIDFDPKEEPGPAVFEKMQKPTPLLKYGRTGNPHFRYFYLTYHKTKLVWHSDKKKNESTEVDLESMARIEIGQKSEIFINAAGKHPRHLSFSIYYGTPPNFKTLDIVCKDQTEFNTWVTGLIWLIANKKEVIDAAATSGTADHQVTGFSANMSNVNVEDLRNQMRTHLDLCTWGSSSWGQLGHADKVSDVVDIGESKKVRHLIDRDVDVKYVDCGEDYTVVISKTGVCYSWGNSNNGRLGLAPPSGQQLLAHVLIPQEIESLRKYIIDSVSCGANHSLFVTGNGQLFATGCNIYGQLGTGDVDDRLTPVMINLPENVRVKKSSCGENFSAIIVDTRDRKGMLYTWGCNTSGNLGHGDKENRITPIEVAALTNYDTSAVSCGAYHMACISTQKNVLGLNLDDRNISGNPDEDETRPMSTAEINIDSELALLFTWGSGEVGQLGHGDTLDSSLPKVVDHLRSKIPVKISCGSAHTVCIFQFSSDISQLYMWGLACSLSSESHIVTSNIVTPTMFKIALSSNSTLEDPPIDVACGSLFSLILTENGYLHIYGRLPSPQISHRIENYSDKDPNSIAAGHSHMALLVGRKWINDEETDRCMNCQKVFVFAFRGRHHCRSCGGIYCDDCTKKRAAVLKFGYQEKVRVCDNCYVQITTGLI